MDTTLDKIIAAARRCGFSDLELIRRTARPALALTPDGPAGDPGDSKIGGLPLMPPSVPWPRWKGTSLSFIAQVNLATIPSDAGLGLPRKGLLLFFYAALRATWGFDPDDAGSFAVIYAPDLAGASVPEWPDDLAVPARYRECTLLAEETMALPPWESPHVDNRGWDLRQEDAYLELLEALAGAEAWASRGLLGGYPDQIQRDMMLECAVVTAGLSLGRTNAYEDPRFTALSRAAPDWRLLLQIPSSRQAGMMWGDAGCLYYCMREQDIRQCRFDRTWMVLQCS